MEDILDNTKAFVLPYGRYLGIHNNKSILQVSSEGYREVDEKWDGILRTIAEAPSLEHFYNTLRKAGVDNVQEYVDNLINNNLLALVDMSVEFPSLNSIYSWVLYPTLNYKGPSKTPGLSNLIQIMITTEATKMPFNISLLTTSILSENLDKNEPLYKIAPKIISEFVTETGVTEKDLQNIFVEDLRKLFQRKGAFLGE